MHPEVDLIALSRKTPGYVAADLMALCREAGTLAVRRVSQSPLIEGFITMEDFTISLKVV